MKNLDGVFSEDKKRTFIIIFSSVAHEKYIKNERSILLLKYHEQENVFSWFFLLTIYATKSFKYEPVIYVLCYPPRNHLVLGHFVV